MLRRALPRVPRPSSYRVLRERGHQFLVLLHLCVHRLLERVREVEEQVLWNEGEEKWRQHSGAQQSEQISACRYHLPRGIRGRSAGNTSRAAHSGFAPRVE